MKEFWLCFVPLFVAVDAVGGLPIFLGLTEDLNRARQRVVVLQSVLTAALVALAFLAAGPLLLRFLGITIPDFMVAGGILLLVISLRNLLNESRTHSPIDPESLGAVPIGIPLITGPAVLTTSILLASTHGKGLTAAALVVNICLAGLLFAFARPITQALGRVGTKIVSKVASLLLTAIAVMLIRRGLVDIVAAAR
jgi:multiple antibiotic resistance protein